MYCKLLSTLSNKPFSCSNCHFIIYLQTYAVVSHQVPSFQRCCQKIDIPDQLQTSITMATMEGLLPGPSSSSSSSSSLGAKRKLPVEWELRDRTEPGALGEQATNCYCFCPIMPNDPNYLQFRTFLCFRPPKVVPKELPVCFNVGMSFKHCDSCITIHVERQPNQI